MNKFILLQNFFINDFLKLSEVLSLIIFLPLLFSIGLFGVIYQSRNLIILFICLEIMLISSAFIFLIISICTGWINGLLIFTLILGTTATEMCIGLSLIVYIFKLNKNITFQSLKNTKI